jgi:hypothetical protein
MTHLLRSAFVALSKSFSVEVGTSTAEARNIFRKVITEGGALNRTRDHTNRDEGKVANTFSFESQAALVYMLAQEDFEGCSG